MIYSIRKDILFAFWASKFKHVNNFRHFLEEEREQKQEDNNFTEL